MIRALTSPASRQLLQSIFDQPEITIQNNKLSVFDTVDDKVYMKTLTATHIVGIIFDILRSLLEEFRVSKNGLLGL